MSFHVSLELEPLSKSFQRTIITEEVFLSIVEDFDVQFQRAELGEPSETYFAVIRQIFVFILEVAFDVIKVFFAKAAVRQVSGRVSLQVLCQLRLFTKRTETSFNVTSKALDFLVNRQDVSIKSWLLSKRLSTVVALVRSHSEMNNPIVTWETNKSFLADWTFLWAFSNSWLMDSHMSVVLASYLKQHSTLIALVRIALLLVNSLMLSEIGWSVVSSWAFVAKEVTSVDMMCKMVLKVVQAWVMRVVWKEISYHFHIDYRFEGTYLWNLYGTNDICFLVSPYGHTWYDVHTYFSLQQLRKHHKRCFRCSFSINSKIHSIRWMLKKNI